MSDVDRLAVPTDPGAGALERHNARIRRLRIIYSASIVAVVAVALVIVKIAYQHGEISHASLHTVATAPPSVARQDLAKTLGTAWTSSDHTAIGTPYSGGTVVTYDDHTVRGRDARTGKQTWSYTRTDRTVCTAMQSDSSDGTVTVAVYRLHGDCDEVTALDSQTGARKWTRTLFEDTAAFDGPATFFVAPGSSAQGAGAPAYFYFVSRTSIYSIASAGYYGWTFHHVGCTINSAVGGAAGVLISQTCKGEQCGSSKFCGNGTQLLLRDATANYDDNDKTNNSNPDQIKWNTLGSALVPTLAGRSIAARDANGASLHLLASANGKQLGQLALSGAPSASAVPATTSFTDADLLWLGGRTYALTQNATSFAWSLETAGVPTSADTVGVDEPLAGATVSAVTSGGTVSAVTSGNAALLAGDTGKQASGYAIGAQQSGTVAYRFGAGFVLAGTKTTVLS